MSPDEDLTGARPLSFGQEGIWLAEQLNPSIGSNLIMAIRLSGPLNVGVLRRSLGQILQRHEVLRTTFEMGAQGPVQVLQPANRFVLSETDLNSVPEDARERRWRTMAVEEARRPFDLQRGPLIRGHLLKIGLTEHVLLVPVHHIVFDGWSVGVFVLELVENYKSGCEGSGANLAELTEQYADFADWQRSTLSKEIADKQLAYWKKKLAGDLPTLDLPTDRPRSPRPAHRGAREVTVLPPDLVAGLEAIGQKLGVTLFMTLVGALHALLGRYTGRDDIIVGSSIAQRSRIETLPLIGFFLNMLPFRVDLESPCTFAQLLRAVRETVTGAFVNSELPYHRLVAELGPARDQSRNTLFQVEFQSLMPRREPMRAAGLAVELLDLDPGVVWTDLEFTTWGERRGQVVAAQYDTALFDGPTVRRLLGHYRVLLQAIVDDPDQEVSQVSLLTRQERADRASWRQSETDFNGTELVHQLFEYQAARRPTALALSFQAQALAYDQLERRANQLARHLSALGAGPGVIVAVALPRSIEMVVGVLAVLKTGAAYLPLDHRHPTKRLSFILEDSGIRLLLTESGLRDRLPLKGFDVVEIDGDRSAILSQSDAKLDVSMSSEGLAYVMYTSGSTGLPKGVEVPHRAVTNLLASMAREPGLTEDDTLLAITTASFDISVLELMGPLSVGGRVVIVGDDVAADGSRLIDALSTSGATVMQAVPATWRMLFQCGWKGDEELKVLCGGEALPRDLARELVVGCKSVWNLYGPTETTIWSTCERLAEPDAPVLIGRPIANTTVHVLDRNRNPQPVGVPGELFIGGAGLARGYRNRADLTAERFVKDPFAQTGDARLYRTGDLARFRADGKLEYLKRLDHQVKVRGFRIELGEIEAVLAGHDAVDESVVVTREYGPGDVRLVGYFVCRPSFECSGVELQRYLRDRVPEFMVPRLWVGLPSLPQTPNGKIDREGLPAPESQIRPGYRERPTSPAEQMVVDVFEAKLAVDNVCLHDNFFDLGGHSLLAVAAIMEIEERTGHRLAPADLSIQTVQQLAAECESGERVAELQSDEGASLVARLSARFRGATATKEG